MEHAVCKIHKLPSFACPKKAVQRKFGVRPFLSTKKPANCQCSAQNTQDQSQRSQLLSLYGVSLTSIGLLSAVFTPPASAEDAVVETLSSGPEDIIVSVIFTVVVALLALLTGGVIYLNVKQALDNKQEMEDRQKETASPAKSSSSSSSNGTGTAEDVVVVRPGKVKRDKSKGFGNLSTREF